MQRSVVIRHLAILLLGLPLWATASEPADLSPQAEYTLQARVLLHDDAGARQILRDRGEGYEPAFALEWQLLVDDVPAALSRQGAAAPSPAATHAFVQALALRLPRVNCAAEAFVPLGSPQIGLYQLVCQHPDVEPLRKEYLALRAAPEAGRQARIDALFLRWAATLRDAPDVPHCSRVTGWHQARHAFAHAERVHQLYQTILWRLLPVELWLGEPLLPQADELCDDG